MAGKKQKSPKQIIETVDAAIENYRGNSSHLEAAIGAWLVGRRFGWRIIYLMHDRKTINRHQKILGVKFQEDLPEVGDLADKSMAWKAFGKLKSFWKAVKGEIPGIKSPEIN